MSLLRRQQVKSITNQTTKENQARDKTEATSTRSQRFSCLIFFFLVLKKYIKICIHKTTENTPNDVVYLPDQYITIILPQRYTTNGDENLEHVHNPCALYTNMFALVILDFSLVKLTGSVASAAKTQACSQPLLLSLSRDVEVSDQSREIIIKMSLHVKVRSTDN